MTPPPAASSPEPERAPLSEQEERELLALAEELRRAHPAPSVPEGFAERLAGRQPPAWTWRATWQRKPLLRAAAALLVVTATGVPVLAVMHLAGFFGEAGPDIRFEPPLPAPLVERADSRVEAVPPAVPQPAESPDLDWSSALEMENRLRVAAIGWQRAFPRTLPDLDALLDASSLDREDARIGWTICRGDQPAEAGALAADWTQASAGLLWSELQRRLARGDSRPPGPALERRVRELWAGQDPGSAPRRLLSGWMRILEGASEEPGLLPER